MRYLMPLLVTRNPRFDGMADLDTFAVPTQRPYYIISSCSEHIRYRPSIVRPLQGRSFIFSFTADAVRHYSH
jgi:hypothetical protein